MLYFKMLTLQDQSYVYFFLIVAIFAFNQIYRGHEIEKKNCNRPTALFWKVDRPVTK